MKRRTFLAGAAAAGVALAAPALVRAQEVTTLRLHQFLPAQATIPALAIAPWVERVEAASAGRLRFELYPAMQLGGAPADLYDQARDGVVDLVWTVLGYTPGRFPRAEVFELPWMVTRGEATSVAFHKFVAAHAMDEFAGVRLLCAHAHGPGLFHSKDPITRLEDLKGMKVRGGSRIINDLLAQLGAEPVGLPVPQVPEALSTGVINATTVPWEVTPSLKIAELVRNHTGFAGQHGLYTQTFGFIMNLERYDSLPVDLQAIIDANSGVETARAFGAAMDAGDATGRRIAEEAGNSIVTLDADETARWKAASQPTIDRWVADMQAAGADGAGLYEAALAAVTAEA